MFVHILIFSHPVMYVFMAGTQRPPAATAAALNMFSHPIYVYIRTPYVCTYSDLLSVCIIGGSTEANCCNGRTTAGSTRTSTTRAAGMLGV